MCMVLENQNLIVLVQRFVARSPRLDMSISSKGTRTHGLSVSSVVNLGCELEKFTSMASKITMSIGNFVFIICLQQG